MNCGTCQWYNLEKWNEMNKAPHGRKNRTAWCDIKNRKTRFSNRKCKYWSCRSTPVDVDCEYGYCQDCKNWDHDRYVKEFMSSAKYGICEASGKRKVISASCGCTWYYVPNTRKGD